MCTLVKFWKTPQNRTISVTILVQSAQNLVEIVRFGGSLSKLYQWALENDTNNWRTKPFLNILPVFLAIHFRKHVFFLILTLRTFSMNSDIVHLKWLILMTHFKGSGKTRVLLSNPRALFFGSIWHTESDDSFINFKFRSRDEELEGDWWSCFTIDLDDKRHAIKGLYLLFRCIKFFYCFFFIRYQIWFITTAFLFTLINSRLVPLVAVFRSNLMGFFFLM